MEILLPAPLGQSRDEIPWPGQWVQAGAFDRPAGGAAPATCECGSRVVRQGACAFCPCCGWSSCHG